MKKLTFNEMEKVKAGSILACISQVSGGMTLLGSLAAIGLFSMTPVGWGLMVLGAISLATGVAADPTACD